MPIFSDFWVLRTHDYPNRCVYFVDLRHFRRWFSFFRFEKKFHFLKLNSRISTFFGICPTFWWSVEKLEKLFFEFALHFLRYFRRWFSFFRFENEFKKFDFSWILPHILSKRAQIWNLPYISPENVIFEIQLNFISDFFWN